MSGDPTIEPEPTAQESSAAVDEQAEAIRAQKRRAMLGLASACVSAGLVAWLVTRIDGAAARALLREASVPWLLAAVGITLLFPLTSAWRWLGVLRAQPELRLPFTVALRAVMIANVLNSLLPSKAGDIMKAVYLRRRVGLTAGVGTVVLERLVDLAVLGAMGVAGWALGGAAWGLGVGLGLVTAVTGVLAALLMLPHTPLPLPERVRSKALGFSAVFVAWLRCPAAIVQTLAGSVATWGLCGLLVCALAAALRLDLAWSFAFSVYPLALLAGLVPLTISGVGTRDAAFVALLGTHVSLEAATLVGLGYTLFAYWLLSLICLPAVYREIQALVVPQPKE